MKTLKRFVLWTVAVIVIAVIAAVGYLKLFLPNVGPAPEMKVEATPDRIARGAYLANHVTVCIDCHSQRDWTRFAGPPREGTLGMGGDVFNRTLGFPGTYYANNITPAGISRYTDGELFRVITTGVTKEGKALFPLMPYSAYGRMDEEDIKSIIAYIRTLKPINNAVPQSSSDFPMNLIINTIPHRAQFSKLPETSDGVAYGKYLVNAAGCIECHSKAEKGKLITGTEFGGGREFPFPDGSIVRSSNISPDEETGLGRWTAEAFAAVFHSRSDARTLATKLAPDKFNSVMPWTMYGGMKDADLKMIFAYLKTVKPVKNTVVVFTPTLIK